MISLAKLVCADDDAIMLRNRDIRSAFSLIELVLVLAIFGVVMALLLPAMQRVREAAAATHCQNNLRQIALATLQFHEANSAFPPARIVERPGSSDPPEMRWGGEHPSWFVRILPHLEQESAFRLWDLALPYNSQLGVARMHVVPSYLCPARRGTNQALVSAAKGPTMSLPCGCTFAGVAIEGGAAGDYAGNQGDLSPGASGLPTDFYWGGNGTGVIISSRGGWAGDRPYGWIDRISQYSISDGCSNTILAGEMHVAAGKLSQIPDNGPLYDGSSFYNLARVAGTGVPLARDAHDDVLGMGLFAFGSWHRGICHFAFADGRVSALSTHVTTTVLERLCNRADGQVVSSF